MSGKTRIILDLNGVVMGGVNGLILKFCLGQIACCKMNPWTFFCIAKKALRNTGDMTDRERSYIDAFVATKYYETIPFLPGAIDTCHRLMNHDNVLHICSAGALSDTAERGFRERIYENIGSVFEMHFIPALESKANYYQDVRSRFPNDNIIVVDDSMRHIKSALALGLDTRYINVRHGFRDLNAAFYGNKGR